MIPLQVVGLLSTEEAQDVWSKLLELRYLWRDLGEGNEFALGGSSYLDGTPNSTYFQLAITSRPILIEHFGWLYQRILQAVTPVFQVATDLPVSYSDELALPGFVCLLRGSQRRRWVGAHVDFNVQTWMKYENQTFELDRCASFTLPIRLPPTSSGLRIWPEINANHVHFFAMKHGLSQPEASVILARNWPFDLHEYSPGQLVIHSGQALHEVEPWEPPDGDGRITLQGHAVVRAGRWELFW
jgi:hypothetical protein